MKKRLKYIVFSLSFYFLFIINVFAGVCDGHNVNCPASYKFNVLNQRSQDENYPGHAVFKSSVTNYSGLVEYGLCIDQGLNSPANNAGSLKTYELMREISITGGADSLDKDFYRLYQKYVNAMGYNYSGREDYLISANKSARMMVHERGGELSGSTFKAELFNNDSTARSFYDSAKSLTLWSDPLSFDTSVSYDAGLQVYTFKITVNFTNSTSQYFYSTTSGLINGDYNIDYGEANFCYEFQINNGAYDIPGNTLSYTGDIGHLENVNAIVEEDVCRSHWNENSNSPLTFEIKMSKDTYDVINEDQGKVFLNLNYKTYHPMSHENVIVVSSNDTSYQRLLVFTKYIKHGKVSTEGTESEDTFNVPLCNQNGNNFYYNSNTVTIQEYKEKCGCANINRSNITNSDIRNVYDSECSFDVSHEYTSTMKNCDSDSGSNTITHKYTKKVEDNNKYCKLKCTETVIVEDFTDRYSVLAGKYFELNKYPKLTSSKNCSVDVFYTDWKKDYELLLNDELNAVNKLLFDYGVQNPSYTESFSCSCGYNCFTTGTKKHFNYKVYSYNNQTNTISVVDKTSSYKQGGCGDSTPDTNDLSYNQSMVTTKLDNLNKHFGKLKSCNVYLNNQGEDYYKFSVDLSFYYEQEYLNLGIRLNNNKPDGEDDDSKFKKVGGMYLEDTTTNYNSSTYINDTYAYPYISSISGNDANLENRLIGSNQYNNYSINRIKKYFCEFEPSVEKYVDSFTGIVSSNYNSLDNPIPIKGSVKDNVYDTNITALSKSNNKNYYEFKSLGDNNKIYDVFTSSTAIKLNGVENVTPSLENLKRYCDYETVNEVIVDSKLNIVFNIVDSDNIDPNDRINQINQGFENWKDDLGKAVKNKIESDDIFNPDNLEYSFVLDGKTIKNIREYNMDNNYIYDDYQLECEEDSIDSNLTTGKKCKSSFVETFASKDNMGHLKGIGRTSWKEFSKNPLTGKCKIDGEEVTC